jgi:uncharacterized protein
MESRYKLNEINFIWDEQKAISNIKKHPGITFEEACEVFFDPFLRIVDGGIVENELRDAVIEMTENWRLFNVAHILRDETFRIISARKATKAERAIYEN